MKYIFLNLKRFDVPPQYGGVNRLAPVEGWGLSLIHISLRMGRPAPPTPSTP